MNSRLKEEVAKNTVVAGGAKIKRVRFPWSEMYNDMPGESNSEPLDLDLVPDKEEKPKKAVKLNDKLVDYTRSKRTVNMRVRDGFDQDVSQIKHDKT